MSMEQTMIKMVLDRWYALIKNTSALLDGMTDEQLQQEVSPGRNRGIYLLGHLIAVHDDMLRLLEFGEKQYPELTELFLKAPDKAIADIPSAQELRAIWNKQCPMLAQQFDSLQPEEWFQKHSAATAEDFIKEPHRNKLNIIITRTSHLAYHSGQMVLLPGSHNQQ